jgi:single-stranded-DNA-specific exonuclease
MTNRDLCRAVAADMGYVVGPRLNAAGRLEDMELGIECLFAETDDAAWKLAQELDRLNRSRRLIQQEMGEQADRVLERLHRLGEGELPAGLCLYDDAWHQGVVGLLATRIKDQYHRPVIAFADGGEALLKGSARSIQGLHMRDLLERIASRHPGLVLRFGGHAMAAGVTLPATRLADFKQAFEAEVASSVEPAMLQGTLLTDGELEAADLCLELAQLLRESGPWGQGFPEPLFEGEFHLLQQQVVGESHLKMRLAATVAERPIDAIAFNQPALSGEVERIRLAYRLDVNDFRGRLSPQLIVEHIQP